MSSRKFFTRMSVSYLFQFCSLLKKKIINKFNDELLEPIVAINDNDEVYLWRHVKHAREPQFVKHVKEQVFKLRTKLELVLQSVKYVMARENALSVRGQGRVKLDGPVKSRIPDASTR